MDIDTISPGDDFVDVIEHTLSKARVLLAVIGPQWVDAVDEKGERRLANPLDFVRLEIRTALERDIRVIPVLVGGRTCPLPISFPTICRNWQDAMPSKSAIIDFIQT